MPKDHITIRWQCKAGKKAVWDAWTKPERLTLWFGSDPKGTVISAKVDLHINGEYEVTFQNSDRTEYTCFGTYKEIVPLEKLVFTWAWKNKPEDIEHVSLSFTENPTGTEMVFELTDIDINTSHNYEKGWNSTFRKLDNVLSVNS